ncbi:hypothetical protein FRC98_11930 [Lujinxingia vulgaris]|uniref:Uncharacterized protein n=1 Tax=Lujinxingia vulgaris TaxID=2600176 RepID=A0A5C6XGI2_9DELT|nr:hypothetical protein [Lujinxingia vulgaris]TXD36541.1 hypothetical protein FRC98_11930 [Lujinxingia vulgaris]
MGKEKTGEESTLKQIGGMVALGLFGVMVVASFLTDTVSAELECVGSRCRIAHTSRIGTTSYGDVFDVSRIKQVERSYYQPSGRSSRQGLFSDYEYYVTVTMPDEFSGSRVSEAMPADLVDPLVQRIDMMRTVRGR